MGKKKINTEFIENEKKRITNIRKRVNGAGKKVAELGNMTDIDVFQILRIPTARGGKGDLHIFTNLVKNQLEEFFKDILSQIDCNHCNYSDLNDYKIKTRKFPTREEEKAYKKKIKKDPLYEDTNYPQYYVTEVDQYLFKVKKVTSTNYDPNEQIATLQMKKYEHTFDVEEEKRQNTNVRELLGLKSPAEEQEAIRELKKQEKELKNQEFSNLNDQIILYKSPPPPPSSKKQTPKTKFLEKKRKRQVEDIIEYTEEIFQNIPLGFSEIPNIPLGFSEIPNIPLGFSEIFNYTRKKNIYFYIYILILFLEQNIPRSFESLPSSIAPIGQFSSSNLGSVPPSPFGSRDQINIELLQQILDNYDIDKQLMPPPPSSAPIDILTRKRMKTKQQLFQTSQQFVLNQRIFYNNNNSGQGFQIQTMETTIGISK
jgi:hypothetical protein